MTADRQGGTDSHISALCGTLLSDERSRTTPDSSHVLLIATHDSKDEFRVTSVRLREGNTVTFVLVFYLKIHVSPLVRGAKGRAELRPSEWVCLVWVKALWCFKTPTLLRGTLIPSPRTLLLNPGPQQHSWPNVDAQCCYSTQFSCKYKHHP